MRDINAAALALIESFESCRLKAYQDIKGIWTIGWGHTGADVTDDTPDCTQALADAWKKQDLATAEVIVCTHITTDLSDNEYGACVSLAYNAGSAPFVGTFGKLLNADDFDTAILEFDKWDHIRKGGILQESDGLLRRREAEKALFLTDDN